MEDTRLIYVYDGAGTLVNGKPFVGFEKASLWVLKGNIKHILIPHVIMEIMQECRTNGNEFMGYYFRTRPTTVFKSKVKFYSLKLKK